MLRKLDAPVRDIHCRITDPTNIRLTGMVSVIQPRCLNILDVVSVQLKIGQPYHSFSFKDIQLPIQCAL